MGNPKTTIHHLPDWIFDSGLFYVAVADMEGKYLYVNDYFLKRGQSSQISSPTLRCAHKPPQTP
mgnify:CR=1 FL=1